MPMHPPQSAIRRAVPVSLAILTCAAGIAATERQQRFDLESGSVAFEVGTTLPAIRVHGKAKDLHATARLRYDGAPVTLVSAEATVPVAGLSTGLSLRDEHMREYVFTTAQGDRPDLRFQAAETACVPAEERDTITCPLSGTLTIRGLSRPLAVVLRVKGSGATRRASAEAVVRLSAYDIPAPSQLGVSTRDEVKVRLELTASVAP